MTPMASATPQAPDQLPPAPGFWGPFRPLFGGHTLFESATSSFLPTFVVFVWRFLFACFLVIVLVYYAVMDVYHFETYAVWVHIGLALSFLLLSMCSFLFLIQNQHAPLPSRLAFCSILLYQTFATAALFFDLVFWVFLFDSSQSPNLSHLAQNMVNVAMVVLDIALSLRIQFKLVYSVVFVTFTLIYVIFVWARFAITDTFVYDFLDYRTQSNGITVAYYLGGLAWALVACFITFVFSRLSRLPCVKVRSTYSKDGSPASHRNRYFAFV